MNNPRSKNIAKSPEIRKGEQYQRDKNQTKGKGGGDASSPRAQDAPRADGDRSRAGKHNQDGKG